MRRQKKNRMTKDTIPEGFSVKLALVDLIPVVFFGLSAVRVGSLFHSALFIAGAALCLVSGIVKVLWKGIVAVSGRNVWPLFVQMRVAMPVGFALLLAAISKQKTALCAVFLFPLFMASWLPLNLVSLLFRTRVWKEIEHGKTVHPALPAASLRRVRSGISD